MPSGWSDHIGITRVGEAFAMVEMRFLTVGCSRKGTEVKLATTDSWPSLRAPRTGAPSDPLTIDSWDPWGSSERVQARTAARSGASTTSLRRIPESRASTAATAPVIIYKIMSICQGPASATGFVPVAAPVPLPCPGLALDAFPVRVAVQNAIPLLLPRFARTAHASSLTTCLRHGPAACHSNTVGAVRTP